MIQCTLFETLQREFCPPLDSSLLVALLADLDIDDDGGTSQVSKGSLDTLQLTLSQLATAADEATFCDDFNALQMTCPSTEESISAEEFDSPETSATTSSNPKSSSSLSSQQPYESPLRFLRAALPHISTAKLKQALESAPVVDVDTIDMEELVTSILTEEYLRELEERGVDAGDEVASSASWETVTSKKNLKAMKAGKRKHKQGQKIVLGDVLQRNRRPTLVTKGVDYSTPKSTPYISDPWAQLTSLSDHLAELLPPNPAHFFKTAFHSGKYPSRYETLRASLISICSSLSGSPRPEDVDNTMLFGLLDVLLPSYNTPYSSGDYTSLISDAQLALVATEGRTGDAFDLVKVLRDLDEDRPPGNYSFSTPSFPSLSPLTPTIASATSKLLSAPRTTDLPPGFPVKHSSESLPSDRSTSHQWQTVPQRSVKQPHPHAEFIRAYRRYDDGMRNKGADDVVGKGGKENYYEPASHKKRIAQNIQQSNELLREASKIWQSGNKRNRGGEVAFYFAQRAREIREQARKDSLDAVRSIIESKRLSSHDQAMDLHGTTVSEATVIVKEVLERHPPTTSCPLKIITGRGTHSVNQVGVLKPAIKRILEDDGWYVHAWDGGLTVRGKR